MTVQTDANTALIAALIGRLAATGVISEDDALHVVSSASAVCKVTERPKAAAYLMESVMPLIARLMVQSEPDDPPGARVPLRAVR